MRGSLKWWGEEGRSREREDVVKKGPLRQDENPPQERRTCPSLSTVICVEERTINLREPSVVCCGVAGKKQQPGRPYSPFGSWLVLRLGVSVATTDPILLVEDEQ